MTTTRQPSLLPSLLLGFALSGTCPSQQGDDADQRVAAVLAEHGGGSIEQAIARLDAVLASGKAPDGSLLAARYRLELTAGKRKRAADTLSKMAALPDAKWRTWAQARARELRRIDPELPLAVQMVSPRLQALVDNVVTLPPGKLDDEPDQLVRIGSPAVQPLIHAIAGISGSESMWDRIQRNAISILARIGNDEVETYFRGRLLDAGQPSLRAHVADALVKLGPERRDRLSRIAMSTDERSIQRAGLLARVQPVQPDELDAIARVFEGVVFDSDLVDALAKLPAGDARVERWVERAFGTKFPNSGYYYPLLNLEPDHPAWVGRIATAMQNPQVASTAIDRATHAHTRQHSEIPGKLLARLSGPTRRRYLAALGANSEVLPTSLIEGLGDDLFGLAICWPKFSVAARETRQQLATRIVQAFGRRMKDDTGPRLALRHHVPGVYEASLYEPILGDIGRFGWKEAAAALVPLLQHPDSGARGQARSVMAYLVPTQLLKIELAGQPERKNDTYQLLAEHGDRSMLDAMVEAIPSSASHQSWEMIRRILKVAEPGDIERLVPVALWVNSQRDHPNALHNAWIAWLDQHLTPAQASALLGQLKLERHTDTLRVACEHGSKSDVPTIVRLAGQSPRPNGSSRILAKALIRHGALDEAMQLAASQAVMLDVLESMGIDTTPAWTARVADGASDEELGLLLIRPATAEVPILRDALLAGLSSGTEHMNYTAEIRAFFAALDPELARSTIEQWLAPLLTKKPLPLQSYRPTYTALTVLGGRDGEATIEQLGAAIRPNIDTRLAKVAIAGLRQTFSRKAVPHLIRALRIDAVSDQAQETLDRFYNYFAEVERWREVERNEEMIKQGLVPSGHRFPRHNKK